MRVLFNYAFIMEYAQDLPEMFIISVFAVSEVYRCGDDNVIITYWCYRNACCSVTVAVAYCVGCCCTWVTGCLTTHECLVLQVRVGDDAVD